MQSLRGVTLPEGEVLDVLRSSFVVGWHNIQKAEHVGLSHGYAVDQTAVGTTNGAGGRNVQLIAMDADGTVLHVMPGFWHPDDLVGELEFALVLDRLWQDPDKDRAQKERLAAAMHRAHVRGYSKLTLARSGWQDFDEREELSRYNGRPRDSIALDDDGHPHVVPVCTLVHTRMLAQPFRQLADFDMETFVDYGRPFYDNNAWIDRGREFKAAESSNRKREREQAKEAAALQKLLRRR